MNKCIRFLVGSLFLLVCFLGIAWSGEVVWEDISGAASGVTVVLTDFKDPGFVCIGKNDGTVLISKDGGTNWQEALRIKGQNRKVNSLYFGVISTNLIYAATDNGLYLSYDKGVSWKRIFKGKGGLDSECTSLAILPDGIYLGTRSGLWISKNQGNTWARMSGGLGNSEIISIDSTHDWHDNIIYVVLVSGVYKIEAVTDKISKVFDGTGVNEAQAEVEEEAEEKDEHLLCCVCLDKDIPGRVYLGTLRGVYESKDGAKTWERLSRFGLLSEDISYLFVSSNSILYAVTKSGIFKYGDDRWHELSFGLSSLKVKSISLDAGGRLYAASEKGLFRGVLNNSAKNEHNLSQSYSNGEPSIKQIQEAAIEYAEVNIEKIALWRKQASKKAWLPQLNMGVNKNSTDLWHWESGSTTKSEDDILRKGKSSVDWDVTVSWDLSEIIWNTDQTSIDTRSRLMVQLREDTLDTVTKTYFERLRVKAELDALKIEDKNKRFEKELKLEELTSLLDGMTGGYFIRNLKKI